MQTGNFTLTPSSLQNYEDYRDQNQVFTGLAGYFGFGLQWTRNGETQGVPAMLASANYFDVLGIKAYRGRLFSPDEDRQLGAGTVVVVSHSLWIREFGSDPNLVGQTMTLNGLPFTVIGITPPGFKGTFSLAGPDRIWVPLSMREQLTTGQLRTLIDEPALPVDQHGRPDEAGRRASPGRRGDEDDRRRAREAVSRRQRRAHGRGRARVRRGAGDQRPRASSCSPAA